MWLIIPLNWSLLVLPSLLAGAQAITVAEAAAIAGSYAANINVYVSYPFNHSPLT